MDLETAANRIYNSQHSTVQQNCSIITMRWALFWLVCLGGFYFEVLSVSQWPHGLDSDHCRCLAALHIALHILQLIFLSFWGLNKVVLLRLFMASSADKQTPNTIVAALCTQANWRLSINANTHTVSHSRWVGWGNNNVSARQAPPHWRHVELAATMLPAAVNRITAAHCLSRSPGKPDPERPLSGRVQGHSEDDREGYSGHRPGTVHEVGTRRQVQMEIGLEWPKEWREAAAFWCQFSGCAVPNTHSRPSVSAILFFPPRVGSRRIIIVICYVGLLWP